MQELGNKPVYPSTEFSESHGNDGMEIKLKLMAQYVAAVVSSESWKDFDGGAQLCRHMYDLADTTLRTYIKQEMEL